MTLLKASLLIFSALVFLNSCQPTLEEKKLPNKEIILHQLAGASDWVTASCIVRKLIKADDHGNWYTIGDRKILISCQAVLKAGINLKELDSTKIILEATQKSISIQLPPPKLISLDIKPESTKVEYTSIGIFRDSFSATERTNILIQGEAQIKKAVPSTGIYEHANKNAEQFLRSWLANIGFNEITITTSLP